MKKIISLFLTLVLLVSCVAFAEDVTVYTPGEYTATVPGYLGDVTVTVTVDETKITAVSAVGANETNGIGSRAIEQLPDAFVAANSADVDGISGATFTSNAMKSAVAQALAQASGTGNMSIMADGEYQAVGRGFNLTTPVNVTVTITDGKIASIAIGENGETNGMPAAVESAMIPAIIENQSLAVDVATGATATSNAVKAAVLDACQQAGASASSLYTEVAKSTETETYDADVVVVGMGGSGTAAALSAAQNGASVFAIDKAAKFAGTSAITSGPAAVNVPSQVAAEIPEWTNAATGEKGTKAAGDTLVDGDALYDTWVEYTTIDGVQGAKTDIIRAYLDASGEMLDWMTENGFAFDAARGFVGGKWAIFSPYTGSKALTESYFAAAYDKFTQMGGRYLLSTEATELLITDGKVAGVKAVKADGTTVIINASKVILATGGFGGSDEMMETYLGEAWKLYGMKQNTGAGIGMAIQAGAATYNISMPPMSHFVAPYMITTAFDAADNDIPYGLVATSEALDVDQTGSRMMDESALAMNAYKFGAKYYAIYSAEQIEILKTQGLSMNASGRYLSQGGIKADVPLTNIDAVLESGIEAGFIYKASSLEELAQMIGGKMTAENLTAAVEGYKAEGDAMGKNASCFTRLGEVGTNSEYYIAITGAPYIYSTCGGLDVDASMRVLDTDGNAIPGLYAVGTDSMGVLFTDGKGYANYGGIAQGWAFYSGMVAGEAAAKE